MNLRLSICIATRNRAAHLQQTLESLAQQVTAAVEVVVVDGASTDRTPEVIERARAALPALTYELRQERGGVDRDFDRAVQLAQGEFCWLMADDDGLAEGAVPTVLEHLARRPWSALIVNASIHNEDLSRVLRERAVDVISERCYGRGEDERLFRELGKYLTFIGGVIVRRELWTTRERESYFGSLFIHVGILFQAPLPDPVAFIARPLVNIRYGNAEWTSRAFEIWMFKWPDLVWSFTHFSESARTAVCGRQPWTRARTLLLYRAKGAYGMAEYRRWLEPRLDSTLRHWQAMALARVPGVLAHLAATIALRLAYRSPGVALLDLQKSRFNPAGRLHSRHFPSPRASGGSSRSAR